MTRKLDSLIVILKKALRASWSSPRWSRENVRIRARALLAAARERIRSAARYVPRIESLKVKLTLGSSAVAASILVFTYVSLTASARRVAAEQAQQHVEELLSYFSGIFAEAVAASDKMQVHLLARALLDNGVQALSVTDGEGKVLYTSRQGDRDEAAFPTADLKPFAGGILGTSNTGGKTILHAATPIRFGNHPVGAIHLWLNRTDLEGRLKTANAYVYRIFAVGFLLMLLLGVIALRMPFHTLKRLSEAANRIGAGDFSGRVPIQGRDEVAAFCQAFNGMVDGVCKAHDDILRMHLETIRAMISVVEAKDTYTQGHCVRVQAYAMKILEGMPSVSPEQKGRIATAALLHDIGKIGIPDEILLKEHRLNRKEVEIVRTHVIIGEKILLHLDAMKEIARWIRHHHERWDGLGYPDGLRGEAIPLPSRIIGVADAIDAMLTDRPYRRALTHAKVTKALSEGKGSQFDPGVIDSAIAFLASEEKVEALVATA